VFGDLQCEKIKGSTARQHVISQKSLLKAYPNRISLKETREAQKCSCNAQCNQVGQRKHRTY
jgi:hypothetical protein